MEVQEVSLELYRQRLKSPIVFEGSWIAGGAITSVFSDQKINDYDYYFKDQKSFEDAIHSCYDANMWCCSITHRAVTFKSYDDTIQLMLFDWFNSPSEIFDAFDFTCCMGAYDHKSKTFIFHSDFMPAVSDRRLTFHSGTRFPIASLMRTLKYQERGYSLSRAELLKIGIACSSVSLNSWDDLTNQIGGIYENRIEIAKDGDFSVTAACDAISNDAFVEHSTSPDVPYFAEEMIERLFGTMPLEQSQP